MKLKPEQLEHHLIQPLKPIYVISGDEILLVQETCDRIRQAARAAGYTEREVYHVDNHTDWRLLYESVQSVSLFAERKIIELYVAAATVPEAAAQFLLNYCAKPTDDNLLLLRCARLDRKALNTKWYKAVEELGISIQIWPVEPAQLPRWIEQRLIKKGFSIEPDALHVLTERVEGNLLAAHQEIEKLSILSDHSRLTLDEVKRCVVDSARFSLFDLVDECLRGNAAHALRMLNGLRSEGVEATLIIWALARELRTLDSLKTKLEHGQSLDQLLNIPAIPKKRIPALRQALKHHTTSSLLQVTQLLREADQAVKGSGGDAWLLLSSACLQLCGRLAPKALPL